MHFFANLVIALITFTLPICHHQLKWKKVTAIIFVIQFLPISIQSIVQLILQIVYLIIPFFQAQEFCSWMPAQFQQSKWCKPSSMHNELVNKRYWIKTLVFFYFIWLVFELAKPELSVNITEESHTIGLLSFQICLYFLKHCSNEFSLKIQSSVKGLVFKFGG